MIKVAARRATGSLAYAKTCPVVDAHSLIFCWTALSVLLCCIKYVLPRTRMSVRLHFSRTETTPQPVGVSVASDGTRRGCAFSPSLLLDYSPPMTELKLVYRGLRQVSDWALRFYSEIYVDGQENVPLDGPLIMCVSEFASSPAAAFDVQNTHGCGTER